MGVARGTAVISLRTISEPKNCLWQLRTTRETLSLCLLRRRHAITLTQARRALLNNRYLIFQLVQFWRDCVRPLRTCCAPKTFLQLSRRQIKILDKDLFEIINIVLLHCVCRCKNTNKRRALLLESSPSGVQHCRNPEVFFVASDRTFSNHPTCKFMKL